LPFDFFKHSLINSNTIIFGILHKDSILATAYKGKQRQRPNLQAALADFKNDNNFNQFLHILRGQPAKRFAQN